MSDLSDHFDQFLRERVYLHNITPKTREFYETAWKAFQRSQAGVPSRPDTAPLITRADVQGFVIHLRERGVTPASCNCWLRGINAFTRWLQEQRAIPESIRVRPQKEEKRLLPVHQPPALRTILGFCPKTFDRWRVYAVACTILDTGCRIDELLTARPNDFDFDNLLLTASGRGGNSGRCRSPRNCGRCYSGSCR